MTGNVAEVDISIDPAEPLPDNGTVTISTEGATDTDMSAFPPKGVYVIISNDTVTVTNQTVDIGTTEEYFACTDQCIRDCFLAAFPHSAINRLSY